MKIYLAANYSTNPAMREIARELERHGHEVTSEWILGTHAGHDQASYAKIDLRDIDAAEALVLFSEQPSGSRTRGGKHVEFGYALAKGKRLFIVGNHGNVFHHLPGVIQRMHFADLLPVLNQAEWRDARAEESA